MDITRRTLLGLGLGVTASTLAYPVLSGSNEQKKTLQSINSPVRSLVTVGFDGNRHLDVLLGRVPSSQKNNPKYTSKHTLLSELEIASETVKQTVLAMPDGHGIERLADGTLFINGHHGPLCMQVDPDHQVMHTLKVPEDYVFSGHSQSFTSKGILVAPVRHHNAKTLEDTGRLVVYDLKTMKELDRIDTGGIHPHEIRLLPNQDEFVITHYGDVNLPTNNGLSFHVIAPKLSVLDAKNLKVKREYPQPKNAIFTHMDIGQDGNVYAISNQYLMMNKLGDATLEQRFEEHAIPDEGLLHQMAKMTGDIALPLGITRVNPLTGEQKMIMDEPRFHLRSQSVAANAQTKKVFATYTYSNRLCEVDEATGGIQYHDAFDYGIHMIRGVTSIANTPYIAISDMELGLAVINAESMQLVANYPMQLLYSTHLFAS